MDTPVLSNRTQIIDAKGRKRGFKLWATCPHCEEGRWVREDSVRKQEFTGLCKSCHAKYTTGQMEEHSRWKGGRMKQDGYVYVKLAADDPFYPMARKSGYVREHRLVMARHINRLLKSTEIVHHKNGIKDDNRVENLELIVCGIYHLLDTNAAGQMTRLKKRLADWNKPRKDRLEKALEQEQPDGMD